MKARICARREINVGTPAVVECPAPCSPFVVVFEDDGETGYFYALDTSGLEVEIQDALQIYDVAPIRDHVAAMTLEILWTNDGTCSALMFNRSPNAVFDFNARRGYCRTGFPPPPKTGWSVDGHGWDDAVKDLFV